MLIAVGGGLLVVAYAVSRVARRAEEGLVLIAFGLLLSAIAFAVTGALIHWTARAR